ncbi:MAG: hypothetical protein ACFFE5_13825 [Candidatus Thorarchaeota archaeon]
MNGEVIFFRLTDVGRSIDLKEVRKIIPAIHDKKIIKTKDTPSYVDFPIPLLLEVTQKISSELKNIEDISLHIKLYSEGVISLIARLVFRDLPFKDLHTIRRIKFKTVHGEFTINNFLKYHYNEVFNQIKGCISEEGFIFGESEYEKYTIYCITDDIENPEEFIESEKNYISALFMGEKPELNLSKDHVNKILRKPFSFLDNDMVILDFDRGLIIDPNYDYEDILLVVEIANYQLLELRALDKLLDRRLAIAEEDIHKIYFKSSSLFKRFKRKVGRLIRLSYDLLFLLENIENVSKLIGDYYLADIYTYLGELFQLKQWSESIRHRLETIENIYNVTQTNINEKFLLYVEILLSFIFIMEFVLLLLDFIL